MERPSPEKLGLPPRPFFYTLDQVAYLLQVDLDRFKGSYVFYAGRSPGIHKKDKIRAVNIAPLGLTPDWRVQEMELIRWLRSRRIRVYERVRLT